MAAEREEDFGTVGIPDQACIQGMNAVWGLGNQLFVFAASGNRPDESMPAPVAGDGPCIHEVLWNTDMHGPLTRKLVNESRNIFISLQNYKPDTEDSTRKPQLVKFSRKYRSVLKACVMGLQSALEGRCTDQERDNLQTQLQLLDMTELVWNLCEILFVETLPGGIVLMQLQEWLKWHFVQGNALAQEVMQYEHPEDHHGYWDAVYSFVLRGCIDEARRMLSLHSSSQTDAYVSMEELLRRMPVFARFTGQSLGEFDMRWRHWQEECEHRLEQEEFATDRRLEIICRILCGDDQVFLDLKDMCQNWYCMLVSRLLYKNPTVKAFELQYHTQVCIDAYGGNSQLQVWDNILLAALEFDLHQVIRESSASASNWWFVAHLTDLLHHCGQLESHRLSFGSNLREFLLLEYASSLMSHHSLWQTGVDYLDHCPEFGRQYLEHYMEHIPIETEKKAQKVLRICEERDMTAQVQSICKVMGMRALFKGRLGSALSWCLRSKDIEFVTFLAEKFLNEYSERGDFSNLDLIDNLGPSMLLSTKLTFLGKYREFHKLYKEGEFKAAASLLLSLLTARLAPKRFWLTLLTDALPLLEAEEVIFNTQQTYELLHSLEELLIGEKLAEQDRTIEGSTEPKKSQAQQELEKEKLDLLKLALARNLARAIVAEGSVQV